MSANGRKVDLDAVERRHTVPGGWLDVDIRTMITELRAARIELAKCHQREHTAWSTVKALAVAYHARASERAADAALAYLDEQDVS